MSLISDWAIVAIAFVAVVIILMIPDRHKPWWVTQARLMTMYFKSWRMKLRLAAGTVAAMGIITGGVTALASYTDYLPATRGYAKDVAKVQIGSALMIATARMGNLQRESSETRLQINQLRREGLRSSRWSIAEKMKSEADSGTRQILQAQLDQIDDDIRDVNAERDRLRIPSP